MSRRSDKLFKRKKELDQKEFLRKTDTRDKRVDIIYIIIETINSL